MAPGGGVVGERLFVKFQASRRAGPIDQRLPVAGRSARARSSTHGLGIAAAILLGVAEVVVAFRVSRGILRMVCSKALAASS